MEQSPELRRGMLMVLMELMFELCPQKGQHHCKHLFQLHQAFFFFALAIFFVDFLKNFI